MRVDICRRSDVAVTEPFLDLFHRYAVCEHQRRAGVFQIVKAYLPQSKLFQETSERFRDPVRLKQLPHFVHKNVSAIFIVVAVAADALVPRLLLLQRHMSILELRRRAGITTSALTKMGKYGPVSIEMLVKICIVLDCTSGEIVTFTPEEETESSR